MMPRVLAHYGRLRLRRASVASPWVGRYRNDLLGNLHVERSGEQFRFRFAAWEAPVASRVSANGMAEFVLMVPSPPHSRSSLTNRRLGEH